MTEKSTAGKFSCLNCNNQVTMQDVYCAQCSQELKESKISFKRLIGDFIDGFLNLDSRLFQTLKHIWKPGFLTREYMMGKRRKYLNPVRLFLFSMIVGFGLLAIHINISNIELNEASERMAMAKSILVEDFDQLRKEYPLINPADTSQLDSIRLKLFDNVIAASKDSVGMDTDHSLFRMNVKEVKILKKDMYELSPDSVVTKYGYEHFLDKLIVRQFIKTFQDRRGTLRFAFGNLIWVIILTILIMGLFMKLLYIRSAFYYVEHFIFLIHYHTFAFFIISIFLIDKIVLKSNLNGGLLGSIVIGVILLHIFLSMKFYYKQSLFKTFLKFLILNIFYIIIIVFLSLMVLFASLLLF